jgi:hypothetical protein
MKGGPAVITIPEEVLAAEPWLAGYVRAADESIDDVRRRAVRATTGELHRRTRNHEPPLQPLRQVATEGVRTTALDETARLVADDRDHISTRPAERSR